MSNSLPVPASGGAMEDPFHLEPNQTGFESLAQHDGWFDKNEIKFGNEWRRSITDGILKSHRVFSFLSRHFTRDPGVCRDEIAIAPNRSSRRESAPTSARRRLSGLTSAATKFTDSEQEVQPPVNIGHIQWLDMHDWKERRAAGEAAWERWYQAKLAEIVRVVESDESRRFAGEIETLNGHLKPIKSEARICQLLSKGFYERQWLFEAVEQWRSAGLRPGSTKDDHRNAPRVVRSLAFQLATRLPDYRELPLTLPEIAELDRKEAAELFDYLLANPQRPGTVSDCD